jgi:hypothetical protein
MNNFLNENVKASMPAADSKRIPLSYAHKKELDTFYEVDPDDLPPVIRSNLNRRHKPKVRVTTDQRTGEVIAKIIKCRVADIDVYSPRTTVDWRVSVNLEMEYEGDHTTLPMADASRGGRGERNKDRMSYRHLAYQIDLTQVARTEVSLLCPNMCNSKQSSDRFHSLRRKTSSSTSSRLRSRPLKSVARGTWLWLVIRRTNTRIW